MPFTVVQKERLDEIWPIIYSGISRAANSGYGEADADDVLAQLKSGQTLLVMITSDRGICGMVVSMQDYPKYRVCKIHAAFGKNLHTGTEEDEFEDWLRSVNCKYVEAQCSTDSRVKVFGRHGYKPVYQVIRKEL